MVLAPMLGLATRIRTATCFIPAEVDSRLTYAGRARLGTRNEAYAVDARYRKPPRVVTVSLVPSLSGTLS
jgi:hypothetical protein